MLECLRRQLAGPLAREYVEVGLPEPVLVEAARRQIKDAFA